MRNIRYMISRVCTVYVTSFLRSEIMRNIRYMISRVYVYSICNNGSGSQETFVRSIFSKNLYVLYKAALIVQPLWMLIMFF